MSWNFAWFKHSKWKKKHIGGQNNAPWHIEDHCSTVCFQAISQFSQTNIWFQHPLKPEVCFSTYHRPGNRLVNETDFTSLFLYMVKIKCPSLQKHHAFSFHLLWFPFKTRILLPPQNILDFLHKRFPTWFPRALWCLPNFPRDYQVLLESGQGFWTAGLLTVHWRADRLHRFLKIHLAAAPSWGKDFHCVTESKLGVCKKRLLTQYLHFKYSMLLVKQSFCLKY